MRTFGTDLDFLQSFLFIISTLLSLPIFLGFLLFSCLSAFIYFCIFLLLWFAHLFSCSHGPQLQISSGYRASWLWFPVFLSVSACGLGTRRCVSRPFILSLFALTPLANLHNFLICTPHFRFNALWLAACYYSNPLFMMGMSFPVYAFLIYAHFFRNTTSPLCTVFQINPLVTPCFQFQQLPRIESS
jgi:hypothetical protein